MSGTAKRIVWLDSCKGFAIMLVVLGHVADGYLGASSFTEHTTDLQNIYNVIYSFHMPLFFTLSGYIFYSAYCVNREHKHRKFKLSILNNIYIYILFSCVFWLIKFIFSENVNTRATLIDLLLIPIKPIFGPYWYLYVLVFYYLIFYRVMLTEMSDKIQLLCSFGISMLGSVFLVYPQLGDWLSLGHSIGNFVFFSLGIYISKTDHTVLLSKTSFVMTFAGTTISAISAIIFDVNLLSVPVIGTITAGVMTIFIINLFEKIKILGKVKIFSLCGQYSLEIYVTHCFITAANRIILTKLGITMFLVNVIINFIMATFIPILCAYILKKIKLHEYIFRPFTAIEKRISSNQT